MGRTSTSKMKFRLGWGAKSRVSRRYLTLFCWDTGRLGDMRVSGLKTRAGAKQRPWESILWAIREVRAMFQERK